MHSPFAYTTQLNKTGAAKVLILAAPCYHFNNTTKRGNYNISEAALQRQNTTRIRVLYVIFSCGKHTPVLYFSKSFKTKNSGGALKCFLPYGTKYKI
jgi:hypothetical protein